jgi:DNA mismatch repair protein MutS2
LKTRATELADQAARRAAHAISTGDAGSARAEARAAIDRVVERLKHVGDPTPASEHGDAAARQTASAPAAQLTAGVRVAVGALGLEGTVIHVHDGHAEVDVRGKRLRAALRDVRVIAGAAPPAPGSVKVNIDLQPRDGSLTDLNVIGCTVEEALTRTEKFLDETTVTDQHTVRLIHGHGTGQLRRALADYLKSHPLVARFETAPPEHGGGGVTVVELKD